MWLYNINVYDIVFVFFFCIVVCFFWMYDMCYDDNISNVVLNFIYIILSMVKINKLNMN